MLHFKALAECIFAHRKPFEDNELFQFGDARWLIVQDAEGTHRNQLKNGITQFFMLRSSIAKNVRNLLRRISVKEN